MQAGRRREKLRLQAGQGGCCCGRRAGTRAAAGVQEQAIATTSEGQIKVGIPLNGNPGQSSERQS